jgi:hypothetical protein
VLESQFRFVSHLPYPRAGIIDIGVIFRLPDWFGLGEDFLEPPAPDFLAGQINEKSRSLTARHDRIDRLNNVRRERDENGNFAGHPALLQHRTVQPQESRVSATQLSGAYLWQRRDSIPIQVWLAQSRALLTLCGIPKLPLFTREFMHLRRKLARHGECGSVPVENGAIVVEDRTAKLTVKLPTKAAM